MRRRPSAAASPGAVRTETPERPAPPEPLLLSFGGVPHTVRPLALADTERLISFFKSHNEETVRLRYGYFFREMTRARAQELVGVDQRRDLALAVFSVQPDGSEAIDAIGRYFLLEDGRTAEMAFVVRESKRRLGMAQALLRLLMDVARHRGLTALTAQVQRENHGMIALFRQAGASVHSVIGADAVNVRLPLAPMAP